MTILAAVIQKNAAYAGSGLIDFVRLTVIAAQTESRTVQNPETLKKISFQTGLDTKTDFESHNTDCASSCFQALHVRGNAQRPGDLPGLCRGDGSARGQ